jgi:hypothetical protein
MATPSMGLTLPTIDGSPGTWDVILNQALTVIDGHTHQIGSGERITPAALSINADLTFAGFAATNLKAIVFTAQASYATSKALWVNSANDDLYYRRAGTDYRLTLNGALNVAIAGGIAGDYAAASASLYYDDAAEAYRFLEAAPAPNDWSRVLCGDLDLYEHASGIANRVRLSSPAALAASYALTFPAAVPGSTQLVQVSSAGVMTFSNTIVNDITMTAGEHITLSGGGEIKHGDRVLLVSPYEFVSDGTFTVGSAVTFADSGYIVSGAAARCAIPVKLTAGDRIKSFTFARYGDGAADLTAVEVWRFDKDGAVTDITAAATSVTNPIAAWNDTVVDITDTTLTAGDCVYIRFTANAANIRIGTIRVTYDRP